MALQEIIGGLLIPSLPPFTSAVPAFKTSLTLNAADKKIAFVVYAPKSGYLLNFEFRTGAVTLNAASRVKISFQGLAAGFPDGTPDQYRIVSVFTTNTWKYNPTISDDGTDTGVLRNVTRGEMIACVIEYDTFTAGDSIVISALDIEDHAALRPSIGYLYDGASWSTPADCGAVMALMYYDYGDETITIPAIPGINPITSLGTSIFNSATPIDDEIGAAFSLPAPVRIGGVVFRFKLTSDVDIVLYDDQYNVLKTVSRPVDTAKASSSYQLILFPTVMDSQGNLISGDVRLEANVQYHVTVKPTTTTDINMDHFSTEDNTYMGGMSGGPSLYMCVRTDGGEWTYRTYRRPWFALFVTAIDHDTSGGSSGVGFEGTQ